MANYDVLARPIDATEVPNIRANRSIKPEHVTNRAELDEAIATVLDKVAEMEIALTAGNSNLSIINGLLSSNSELAQRIFSVLYGVAVNNTPSIVLDAKSRASFYVVNPAFSTVPVIIRMGADDHILNPGQIFLDDTYRGDVYSFAAQGLVKVIIQEVTSGNI